ncbi:nicotinate-nucleotide adenylyltransferase [Chromatium okenii]|uniref:Probable nicotinate-nucleotide adenylyltransferase n=1 Tax=Chromatium okenii TaxID=61644 RepID=A0A2S7XSL6_9GAMM|nr:nicotinate-nucleotide adenylyltransferase [Chromatium okenii]PQJ96533.1 nicotinic acid mononucleotide adenylyltransferase [Chromatium okenii]
MIGILGGTFDPIHFGHLRPALDCLQGLSFNEIRMMPLKVAVHRPQPQASTAQRVQMLKAALVDQTDLTLDTRELERSGSSFSYDTLMALRAELGGDIPLCLLLGADAFANFLTWHRPHDILKLAHLVVMARPGDAPIDDALATLLQMHGCAEQAALTAAPAGRILWYSQATQLAISSTQIRQLIAQGFSPRYLLPDAVLALIEREQLYR